MTVSALGPAPHAGEGLVVEQIAPRVRRIRLDRPERLNALGWTMAQSLERLVREVVQDGTRVLVLRGTGRAFCTGADLKERQGMDAAERYAHNRAINAAADAIASAPIPTIALVNGAALGGGCELALACDLRFGVPDAQIGLTEARLGGIPGAGGTQRLPRLVGAARALEMMLAGVPVTAARAEFVGLLNAVIPADEIDERVLALATLIASRSPRTSRLLKQVVYAGLERPLAEALGLERDALGAVLASPDYAEGLKAFAERREPVFE